MGVLAFRLPPDANGFRHDRMVRLLTGIRDNVLLPAIYIERSDQRPYGCAKACTAITRRSRSASHTSRQKSSNNSIERATKQTGWKNFPF